MKDEFTGQTFGISYSHVTSIEWSVVGACLLKIITTYLQELLGQNALLKVQIGVSRVYEDLSL